MQGKKGPKIRQGSPEEEAALVTHIESLAPTTRQLEEAAQLSELLILLGHEADARKLQTLLSNVISEQAEAARRADGNAYQKIPAAQITKQPASEDVSSWKWDILRPV